MSDRRSDQESDDLEFVDPAEIAKLIAADKEPDLKKISTWLRHTDYQAPSSEYRRHLASQAPGTGEWIRQTAQFRQWHGSDDHGSIWIKAVPGAGKSVVAASMIDSLARSKEAPVLFFFFRHIIENNRTARSLIHDWLSQLLPHSHTLQVALWELVESKTDPESIATPQMWKYLLSGLNSLPRAYCVVDALDEMTTDDDFLSRLNTLGTFKPDKIKVMMTSRPKQYLQRSLRDPKVIQVSLEEELVKRDISVFVKQRVRDLAAHGVDDDSQQLVISTICQRSQGLFLYARLMIDQLTKEVANDRGGKRSEVVSLASQLPIGLESMYNDILRHHSTSTGIPQSTQVLILQLVTHATRPLRLLEVAKAIGARQTAKFDCDLKDIVRSGCGPLLEIMEDEVVQVLHHSFTEFLLDETRTAKPGNGSSQFPVINPVIAHRNVAISCLEYLKSGCFSEYDLVDEDVENVKDPWARRVVVQTPGRPRKHFDFNAAQLQHPLLKYASQSWPTHARMGPESDDEELRGVLESFFDTESSFRGWLHYTSFLNPNLPSHKMSILHVASMYGLKDLAGRCIARRTDLDALDSTKNSPLYWAASNGHAGLTQLLIDSGCQTDIDGYDGTKPLHAAASHNHAQVVTLLLATGVSPSTPKTRDVGRMYGNAPSSVGHSPLRYASLAGCYEVLEAMIPYLATSELHESLHWICAGGHSQCVPLLMNHIEDVDAINIGLYKAAQSRDPRTVRVLLSRGADPRVLFSLPDSNRHVAFIRHTKLRDGTCLHALADSNWREDSVESCRQILQVLASAGTDLEAKDSAGCTALMKALSGDQFGILAVDILDCFLSVGCSPRTTDADGNSLLSKFCTRSLGMKLVERLLAIGLDPNHANTKTGQTSLHYLMVDGHDAVDRIRLLLSKGADVHARDLEGNAPLHHALAGLHYGERSVVNAVDELLSYGADVNARNDRQETCLHRCARGIEIDEKAIAALLGHGLQLEASDRHGYTALLRAIANSNLKLVKLLLSKGSSTSARTFEGKSCLHLALSSQDVTSMLQCLLDAGASTEAVDLKGHTLLHDLARKYCGSSSQMRIMDTLLDRGSPANNLTNNRESLLHLAARSAATDSQYDSAASGRPRLDSLRHRLQLRGVKLDINGRDSEGRVPLHYASAASEVRAYELLTDGASAGIASYDGRTPLHCAARARQSGIISMLLTLAKDDFDLDAKDFDGVTALDDACRSGQPESVKLLLDAGARLDVADAWHACAQSDLEQQVWNSLFYQRLRKSCTQRDVFRPIHEENRPMWNSSGYSYGHFGSSDVHKADRIRELAALLLKAGADVHQGIQAATMSLHYGLLSVLQEKNPDPEGTKPVELQLAEMLKHHQITIRLHQGRITDAEHSVTTNLRFRTQYIPFDSMMARMITADLQTTDVKEPDGDLWIFMSKMVGLGLTELVKEMAHLVKLFDDPCPPKRLGETDYRRVYRAAPLLHVACKSPTRNMEMVKLLVGCGLDVNVPLLFTQNHWDKDAEYVPGNRALHDLAEAHHWWFVEAIEYLVDHGADVDAINHEGKTPLQIACDEMYRAHGAHRHFKRITVEALLKGGADPNFVNSDGLSSLNYAGADMVLTELLLLYGAKIDAGPESPLFSAIRAQDVDAVKFWLEKGANPNKPNLSTPTRTNYRRSHFRVEVTQRLPLLEAVQLANDSRANLAKICDMITLLLIYGANPALNVNGQITAAHYIFEYGTDTILQPFLKHQGLDPNISDTRGRTLFLAACDNSCRYENPPDQRLGHPTYEEQQRLESAYVPAYKSLADYELLGPNIDYTACDAEGRHFVFHLIDGWRASAEFPASMIDRPHARALMTQKDNRGVSPTHFALRQKKPEMAMTFIAEGDANIAEPDPDGNTALHFLAKHIHRHKDPERESEWRFPETSSEQICHSYLSKGGDINARNKDGVTPFMDAVRPESLQWFKEHGADMHLRDNLGQTVLHHVARKARRDPVYRGDKKDRNARLFQMLLDAGCDPLIEDNEARTSLDIAAASGNAEILKLFERRKEA